MFQHVALALVCLFAVSNAYLMSFGRSGQRALLDDHNRQRDATGSGEARLTWSATAASFAASLAEKCQFQHSGNREYGENIYLDYDTSKDADFYLRNASINWGSEIQNVDAKWECAYSSYFGIPSSHTCGHYSQIVWKDTTQVGCAVSMCSKFVLVFCDYTPAGNMMGFGGVDSNGQYIFTAEPPY